MCGKCYRSDPEVREMNRLTESQKVHRLCIKCHVLADIEARGMCRKCYKRTRRIDISFHRACTKCHVLSFIQAHEMCSKCYRQTPEQKEARKLYRIEWDQRPATNICIRCEQPSKIHALGMCERCYVACARCVPEVRNRIVIRNQNRYFLLSGKTVGWFDSNQMLNDRLLKAYSKVVSGNLSESSPTKHKRKSRYDLDWN